MAEKDIHILFTNADSDFEVKTISPVAGGLLGFDENKNPGNVAAKEKTTVTHSWIIQGEIKVPSGQADFIPPMYAATGTLKGYRARINDGTSATVKITKAGSDLVTGISVTTSGVYATDRTDSIAAGDLLAIVVTAVSGTPVNMSFSLIMEYAAV